MRSRKIEKNGSLVNIAAHKVPAWLVTAADVLKYLATTGELDRAVEIGTATYRYQSQYSDSVYIEMPIYDAKSKKIDDIMSCRGCGVALDYAVEGQMFAHGRALWYSASARHGSRTFTDHILGCNFAKALWIEASEQGKFGSDDDELQNRLENFRQSGRFR